MHPELAGASFDWALGYDVRGGARGDTIYQFHVGLGDLQHFRSLVRIVHFIGAYERGKVPLYVSAHRSNRFDMRP